MPVKKTKAKTRKPVTKKKKPPVKKATKKKPAQKRREGRPEKYIAEVHPRFAALLASIGLTEEEMAIKMGIARSTLSLWKEKHPEFSDSIAQGKIEPDEKVERSLYERCVGYYYQAVKILQYKGLPVEVPYIEHCPPDPFSIRLWLLNRKPKEWRDKQEFKAELNYTVTPPPEKFPDDVEQEEPKSPKDA